MRAFRCVLSCVFHRADGAYALVVLGLWIAVAVVSLVWVPVDVDAIDGYNVWAAPSSAHPLGTDGAGHDVLSWLMRGSATELAIVVVVTVLTAALGTLGVWASVGSRRGRGRGSRLWMIVVDTLISIPTVIVALIISVPLGASVAVIVIACTFAYSLSIVRVTRPVASLAASSRYVEAAQACGVGNARIFFTHILPAVSPTLMVQVSMSAGTSILAESGLTYLGVGVPSGTPSWGRSLATGARFITVAPLTVLWPGLVITLVVVALNLLGDALRDCADPVANPRLRQVLAAAPAAPAPAAPEAGAFAPAAPASPGRDAVRARKAVRG